MQSTGRMISTSGLQELIKSKIIVKDTTDKHGFPGGQCKTAIFCKFLQIPGSNRLEIQKRWPSKKIVTLKIGGQLLTLSKRTCVLALQ